MVNNLISCLNFLTLRLGGKGNIELTTIDNKIVETMSSNGITSAHTTIHTPPLQSKLGVFVVFYARQLKQ